MNFDFVPAHYHALYPGHGRVTRSGQVDVKNDKRGEKPRNQSMEGRQERQASQIGGNFWPTLKTPHEEAGQNLQWEQNI